MAAMRSVEYDYNCGDENVRCNAQCTFFVLWLWHVGLRVTKYVTVWTGKTPDSAVMTTRAGK
jgi:hypothetical protein